MRVIFALLMQHVDTITKRMSIIAPAEQGFLEMERHVLVSEIYSQFSNEQLVLYFLTLLKFSGG